jgi:hypothetical protein
MNSHLAGQKTNDKGLVHIIAGEYLDRRNVGFDQWSSG